MSIESESLVMMKDSWLRTWTLHILQRSVVLKLWQASNHLEGWWKPRSPGPIPSFWFSSSGAWGFAWLPSSPVMPVLLLWPHFENQWPNLEWGWTEILVAATTSFHDSHNPVDIAIFVHHHLSIFIDWFPCFNTFLKLKSESFTSWDIPSRWYSIL